MRQLVLLSAVVVSVFALGCGKEKPVGDPPPVSPPSTPGPGGDKPVDPLTAKPDVTMTAEEWDKEFAANDDAAKAKYKGKAIELTGTIQKLTPAGSSVGVHLKVKGRPSGVLGVLCEVSDLNCWERASPGTVVTIRGKLWAEPRGGVLNDCSIVKTEKNAAQMMTAPEFAKLFKADPYKVVSDFGKKWVYLDGEVVSTEKNAFILKGDGEYQIRCVSTSVHDDEVKTLQAGKRVKVLGMFNDTANSKAPNFSDIIFKVQ